MYRAHTPVAYPVHPNRAWSAGGPHVRMVEQSTLVHRRQLIPQGLIGGLLYILEVRPATNATDLISGVVDSQAPEEKERTHLRRLQSSFCHVRRPPGVERGNSAKSATAGLHRALEAVPHYPPFSGQSTL
jgi:hypothetical protein